MQNQLWDEGVKFILLTQYKFTKMKKKNLVFSILLVLLVAFATVIISCEKEDKIQDISDNILYFGSIDDMLLEIDLVLSMSMEEKIQWEESKGFQSIEITSEKLYESINPEKFKSQEEVFNFVEKNSTYLILTKVGNNEYELDTHLSSSPFKYFVNNEYLFQIKDSVYKVFDEGVIAVSEERILELTNSDFENALTLTNKSIFSTVYLNLKKSTNLTCPGATVRTDNGRERIRLKLYPNAYNMGSYWQAAYWYEIRPYKKTLGIWYRVKRTISCDLYMKVVVESDPYYLNYENSGERAYVLEEFALFDDAFFSDPDDFNCESYNSWAKQPNTGKTYAICN